MSFKNKYDINPEFSSLFEFESNRDELKHNAKILMFRFLSAIENSGSIKQELSNKILADALDTSRSFITQLLKGKKIINLVSLARLQKEFNVEFDIRAIPIKEKSISLDANKSFIPYSGMKWVNGGTSPNTFQVIPGRLFNSKTNHESEA